ncbi:MAG: helix-hairpin-helix domain-containing protein [Candidatus Paceibacterota bacterium]|jgi:competence ComEA-like helix-hairpin-helix protein
MRIVGLITLVILLPALVYAVALININTADAALLDTLPGIGPTKATAIIDYRTQHGPFARIEDIQNVSGIGASTYTDIKSLITVGDTSSSGSGESASSTPSVAPAASTYVPPPADLVVEIGENRVAMLEVPLRLFARVTTKGGAVDQSAHVSWSFGDGSSAVGNSAEKVYRYAGTYLITVDAVDGSTTAHDEIVATAKQAKVHLPPVSGDGILIANDSDERLDLSGWRLLSETGSFRIPSGMTVLPSSSVLLPFTITNLPIASEATLVYPDGVIAARSTVPAAATVAAAAQLLEPAARSNEVQTAEEAPPAETISVSAPAHENTAVGAPTATIELAAVGAALPALEEAPTTTSQIPRFLRSPWTLSFLGLMTLAGSAFIFL